MSKSSIPREYWALAALLLLAVFVASPGFFSIDEAIYYLGARALAEGGSLSLDNSAYHQLQSDSLRLRLLVDGPNGLTPQYPAGTALLAAPLLSLLGPRAFILLNALAAIGMVFTVRNICVRQFHSERIARIAIALMIFGTFWLEYAVGVWPHMLSSYFAVQAYWFALCHLDNGGKGYRDAMLSGLFAGAGILFRLDAALVIPAVGLILVLFAPRFVRSSVAFGAAVLPSLLIASSLSYLKFGTPNPFSYGQPGGNTDLAAHGALIAAVGLGSALLVLPRFVRWRPERRLTIAATIAGIAILLLIPAANDLIVRCLKGFWALVVDIRTIEDPRAGVKPGRGGTLLFWTLAKKSLGQSMPWIGLFAILLTGGLEEKDRRFVATILIYIVTMTLPFILLSWHGGGGSNMRYFLPVVPVFCIVGAKLVHDLWQTVPNAISYAAAGVWVVIVLGLGWTFLHPSGYVGVQQNVATYLLIATAIAATAAGRPWQLQNSSRKLTVALCSAGCIFAATSAAADLQVTEKRRAMSHGISETVGALPSRSLVITFPEWAALRVPGNGSITASRNPENQHPDWKLIFDALNANYRVFVTSFEFDISRDVPPGLESVGTDYLFPGGRMIELKRMAKFGGGAEQSGASK